MDSPTTKALRSVWGTGPTDVYAVGEAGIVLRFDGSTWTIRPAPPVGYLLGISAAGGGPPTAVGTRGTVLEGIR
jgi:hypothetical protein